MHFILSFISRHPTQMPSTNENALARAVTCTSKHSHNTLALKPLFWLKVEQHIRYKNISITPNILHKSEPSYRHNLINIKPTGKTPSSNHLCLSLPPLISKIKFSDRSFCNSSPCLLNFLPTDHRSLSKLPPSTTITLTFPSLLPLPFDPLSLSCIQFLACLKRHLLFSCSLTKLLTLPLPSSIGPLSPDQL